MLTIRAAQWQQDAETLSTLDTSFVTERIYRPVREEWGFRLVEEAVTPPLHKRYAFHPSDSVERQNWDYTALAEEDGKLAGFAAAEYTAWNRRVVLWHLYVSPAFRRQKVGTRLIEALDGFARSVQARCLWLETQNVNYPAIQFYRRCGFALCGFDASLYDPESLAQEETALFFARPVSAPSGCDSRSSLVG
ncbi:MAG TPA: GNAT family N-acetyltransferase [Chthonomonadaceae bacterium]|nr:GNAT family N-acetyltransferase [Chthonomonadaceae bacterium]